MIIPKKLIENERNMSFKELPTEPVIDLLDNETQVKLLNAYSIVRQLVKLLHEPQTDDTIDDWVDGFNGTLNQFYEVFPPDNLKPLCNAGVPLGFIMMVLADFSQVIVDNIKDVTNSTVYQDLLEQFDKALLPYKFLTETH